mgnify:CR=1 FL=1
MYGFEASVFNVVGGGFLLAAAILFLGAIVCIVVGFVASILWDIIDEG